MENYIVSARKYRPTTFASVVGQGALTATLQGAIASGKLAHAYLFCGPRGVGKTTCARIFAKTINCLTPGPGGEACGHCESCSAFDEGRSLNIHELDAASNNSVEDIRSLIEQVAIPPQIGRYKVFIIDEVHLLSQAAFNAFLKTLEEPPAHVIFILATTEKHKILPTILSRCQIYDFSRMEVQDIVGHLKNVAAQEGVQYEEEALAVIAQKADGGMRDALSIFDQAVSFTGGNITYSKVNENLNVLDYDYYFRMTDLLLAGDVPNALLTLNEILSKGFDGKHFIGGLASHFRDLLVSRDAVTLPLLEVAASVRQRYGDQAQRCQPKFLFRALRICNNCDINYNQSRNKRLLVEITLIEVAQAQDDDGESSGPGPTKRLKPLFTTAQPTPSAAVPKSQQHTPRAEPAVAQTPPVSVSAAPQVPQPAAVPTAPAAASSAAQGGDSAPARATVSRPRRKTVSLKGIGNVAGAVEAVAAPVAAESAPVYGNKPFGQSEVDYQWLRFANTLSVEQAAIAARMKNMAPQLGEGGQVAVAVETDFVKSDLEALRPALTGFFRRELDNETPHFVFTVLSAEEVSRKPTGARERYEAMCEKHPALKQLGELLHLQLA
ncbi:MAG: DNA polymerase III subunit gamma/tau [Alloprevotella sp.]|nr:DNA polymerase III subunit gamma/tau [Alloprevotella sp.]